jgi:hypothetical protein
LSKVRNVQKDTVKDKGEINFTPLLQEIKAQTGKKIDVGFALIMQENITYLIRH